MLRGTLFRAAPVLPGILVSRVGIMSLYSVKRSFHTSLRLKTSSDDDSGDEGLSEQYVSVVSVQRLLVSL
jgi:hypothetical protein